VKSPIGDLRRWGKWRILLSVNAKTPKTIQTAGLESKPVSVVLPVVLWRKAGAAAKLAGLPVCQWLAQVLEREVSL